VHFIPTGHTKQISAITCAPNGYIFVAGEDCNLYSAIVSIWFLNGPQFEYGTNLIPSPGMMLEFTCIKILNNYVLAGTKQGTIFVWMFDFNTNSASILGNIPGMQSPEVTIM
jgi:WD40 repeat protein